MTRAGDDHPMAQVVDGGAAAAKDDAPAEHYSGRGDFALRVHGSRVLACDRGRTERVSELLAARDYFRPDF
jgi:hypothetical protein